MENVSALYAGKLVVVNYYYLYELSICFNS